MSGSAKDQGCCLTIHSSRNRFAVRLNSGVRPLQTNVHRLKVFMTVHDRFAPKADTNYVRAERRGQGKQMTGIRPSTYILGTV